MDAQRTCPSAAHPSAPSPPELPSVAGGWHYFELGFNLHSFVLAVLAGTVITLMTRMQHSTDNLGVQLVPAILFGALLAGGQLFHSVLDSLFMFAGLTPARRSVTWTGWVRWVGRRWATSSVGSGW